MISVTILVRFRWKCRFCVKARGYSPTVALRVCAAVQGVVMSDNEPITTSNQERTVQA